MFWIVEKLGGFQTELETFIATYMLVMVVLAFIGLWTVGGWVLELMRYF